MNYPDFSNSKVISVDIETFDPDLKDLGPGVYRSTPLDFTNKFGYILGVALADENKQSVYVNLGHYDMHIAERAGNIEYLREQLKTDVQKVGTNIPYDLDWIENWLHVPVGGQLHDICVAEALIDENQGKYSLEFIANKYLGVGKVKGEIEQFCEDNGLDGDARKWLYKMPHYMVVKYAEGDVLEPIEIFRKQWTIMRAQNLLPVFTLEGKLIRTNMIMRKNGVPIDIKKRNRNALILHNRIGALKRDLFEEFGEFNFNSSKQLASLFDAIGIEYPLTDKGNPSINAKFLGSIAARVPLASKIVEVRKTDKALNTFLMGSLAKFPVNGNIHCLFHNTRTEENGTRSGRLSSSKPNLQQIPAKGDDWHLGQYCRECFVPLPGEWWAKLDYSQIEYRCISHFAVGPGSEEVRRTYNDDPNTDYHGYIMALTGLGRKKAKNLNFGVGFGMGDKGMADFFGWSLEYAHEIRTTYLEKAAYMKPTMEQAEREALSKGFITTILGRRSRLLDKRKAYTMFNRRIQGSAADMMKKAMVDVQDTDILDTLTLFITVHDELDVSVPKTVQGVKKLLELQDVMQNAIKLKVPVKADVEIGPNWAEVQEIAFRDPRLTAATDANIAHVVETLIKEEQEKAAEKKRQVKDKA